MSPGTMRRGAVTLATSAARARRLCEICRRVRSARGAPRKPGWRAWRAVTSVRFWPGFFGRAVLAGLRPASGPAGRGVGGRAGLPGFGDDGAVMAPAEGFVDFDELGFHLVGVAGAAQGDEHAFGADAVAGGHRLLD